MIVNGESVTAAKGTLLSDYLRDNNYNPARIAVERNGEIVPKATYDSVTLEADDVIEIVHFMGGG